MLAAAADEVSTAVAALFSGHGQAFHALSSQAAAFHAQFVQNMTSGGAAYAGTEAVQRVIGDLERLIVAEHEEPSRHRVGGQALN